jgi:hypothetical protein
MDLFKKATTYKDLKNYTIMFLQNEINDTSYHYGPPDEETELIKDHLIEINKLGCVTTGSQPGLVDDAICAYQRAFVTMLIKINKYEKFKNILSELMNYEVYIRNTTDDNDSEYDSYLDESSSDYMLKSKYWVSAKFNPYDPTFESKGFTHCAVTSIECDSFSSLNIHKKLCKKYIEIEVVDLVWGREALLFENIIHVLRHL